MSIKIDKESYLAVGAVELKAAKNRAAAKLRILLNKHTKVIVGKSSDPANNRAAYYKKLGYKCIYIIYQSKSSTRITHLEAYLNNLYLDKLENTNKGSAGPLSDTASWHYLYVVVK